MKYKILISDEDEEERKNLRSILENYGFDVIEAANGTDILNILKMTKIELVITEVNMHGMDGLTLIRSMKNNKDLREIPVIILTKETDDDLITEGRLIGARAWMLKPYKKDVLISAIEKILPTTV